MKTNRRESQVMAGVLAYLDTRNDLFYWRQNVAAGIASSGQFMRVGVRGVSDIIGLQARRKDPEVWHSGGSGSWMVESNNPIGRFVAIEVKRERGGTQSDDQKRFQDNVEAHGGLYVLARSVEDVQKALGPERFHIVKQRRVRAIPR